jgi:hypothetical protein
LLDSNVLFAAAASATGASRALVILAELGLLRLVVCPQILKVRRNLEAKSPAALSYFERLLSALDWERVDDPSPEQVRACLDTIAAKDAPILAAALVAQPIAS